MKKSEVFQAIKEVLAEKEKPGLWANIRAKRARGEKPAHKNSKAHKDAVKAGKKINAMSEDKSDAVRWFGNLKYYYQKAFAELKGEDRETYKQLAKDFFSKLQIDQKVRPVGLNENEEWPKGTQSRYQEYSFKLVKVMSDRAKYSVTDMETGEQKGTVVFNTVDQLHDYAADLIRPQGGRQSSHFGTNEADGKVNESGYEEAWELLGQPVPEIKNFVKQLGLKNDDATAKKIGAIIDNIKDSSLPANRISVLKNLANKGNDSETLKAIKQISGKPDAEQQYIKLMQARDAGEKRNRGYNVSDLIKAVKSGNYDPPVLLQLPSGLYVIGGRTRLYAALALGIKAKVKIITSDTFK